MDFEKLREQPVKREFVALSYAEQLADRLSLNLLVLDSSEAGWEVQISDTSKDQLVGPTMADTSMFISKLTEFLDEDYPQHMWKDMITITMHEGTFRIKFETQ
jgi:hypothetical protein